MMERMGDGQPTWAEWKSDILGLPREALERYLRDVEGFAPDHIAAFLDAGGGTAVLPHDWAAGTDAAAALARFFDWKADDAARGGVDVGDHEARAAALPVDAGRDERAAGR